MQIGTKRRDPFNETKSAHREPHEPLGHSYGTIQQYSNEYDFKIKVMNRMTGGGQKETNNLLSFRDEDRTEQNPNLRFFSFLIKL